MTESPESVRPTKKLSKWNDEMPIEKIENHKFTKLIKCLVDHGSPRNPSLDTNEWRKKRFKLSI